MHVMLIGAGDARDHATYRRLRRDGAKVTYASLGGNALLRREPDVRTVNSFAEARAHARALRPGLILVQRPELLIDGAVDELRADGHAVLGPTRTEAALEGSKVCCKNFLDRYGVHTPAWHAARTVEEATGYLRDRWRDGGRKFVVKSDRFLSDSALRTAVPSDLAGAVQAVTALGALPEAVRGQHLLIEHRLDGPEVSLHLLLDGTSVAVCPPVCDYKPLHTGDRGPNTHGMGAVAGTWAVTELERLVQDEIVEPLVAGLYREYPSYRGVLYVGLIVVDDRPVVLECNVRPGNPEWIALLRLLRSPLTTTLEAMAGGRLGNLRPTWHHDRSAAVAFATVPGYPHEHDTYRATVTGLDHPPSGVDFFGEGIDDGTPPVAGRGRSFCAATEAATPALAGERLRAAMTTAGFAGMHFRTDIGLERPMVKTPTAPAPLAPEETKAGSPTPPMPTAELDDHAAFLQEVAALLDREEAARRVARMTDRLIQETGRGLRLSEALLAGLDLSGFDLRRANLNRAQLFGTNLSDCDLSEASLICPALERTKFARASLRGAYVHALAAQVCDFRGADLSAITDGTGALFHGCFFNGATIVGSMLSGSSFYQTVFDGARLDGTNFQGCQFLEASAAGASWRDCQLDDAVFTRVDLSGGVFSNARGANVAIQRPLGAERIELSNARLPGLRLTEVKAAKLAGQGLWARGADVRDCTLDGADFSGADLAESSWTRVHATDASFEQAVADNSRWLGCNLDGANLSGLKAENIAMTECSVRNGCLVGIQARCATIRNGVLNGSDLTNAYLYRAMITGDPPVTMDLRDCQLSNAVLVQAYVAANLSRADLTNAHMAYGRLNQSVLVNADLSGAQLFQCTMIKTDFTGARLVGVLPPVLADRCTGLEDALRDTVDPSAKALLTQVQDLQAALSKSDRRST